MPHTIWWYVWFLVSAPNLHTEKSTSDNAALPHGGGTDKSLGKADFALFDCGASLHGYYSDVTRVRGGHIVAVHDGDLFCALYLDGGTP